MSAEQDIAADIKRVANGALTDGVTFPVMSGKVVAGSVDMQNMVCNVQLTGNEDGAPTEGVLLNVVSPGNGNGMILYPADGSNVLVAEIDAGSAYQIVWCSDLVKMVVKIGGVSFTISSTGTQWGDGSLGGLTKTLELQTQINKLNTIVMHLAGIITGTVIDEPGNGGPSALQAALKAAIATDPAADFSNIENKNIKQA